MLHDFLLEIGCEELPSQAAALYHMAQALGKEMLQGLSAAKLTVAVDNMRIFATPRRLAVLIRAVPALQPDMQIEKRGPAYRAAFDAAGMPTPAATGFAKFCNTTVAALEILENAQGKWLVYRYTQHGIATITLLPAIVQQAVSKLPVPRMMRWGAETTEFARPVHWIVMLYGNTVIDTLILGQQTGNISYGHRVHNPAAITLVQSGDYERQLHQACVIADFSTRRAAIQQQLQVLAQTLDAHVVTSTALLDEVTSIVEWPVALLAAFDANFLQVPAEVLIATMQEHQKCFALTTAHGELLPHFITVANLASKDPAQVILGNQRVMHARLSDAAFFYNKDRQSPLSSRIAATQQVIFQVKLGTIYAKSQRLATIAMWLAPKLNISTAVVSRAANLARCDLMTDMVNEFPELQGIMGYYYALSDGEPLEVAVALQQQYWPRFSGDTLPQTAVGVALALAERVDNLIGIFGINQKPSGARDPFKLRRQAVALVRILIAQPYNIDLVALLQQAVMAHAGNLPDTVSEVELVTAVHEFILERFKVWNQEQGIDANVIAAVLQCQTKLLWDLQQRVLAVQDFVKLAAAHSLAVANKRVNNILLAAEFLDVAEYSAINTELLHTAAEQELVAALLYRQQQVQPLCANAQYALALQQLAELRAPVDRFFDEVMVLVIDERIRHNRLLILAHLRQLLLQVADISLLQQG